MDQRSSNDPASQTPFSSCRTPRLPLCRPTTTGPYKDQTPPPPTPEFEVTQTPETFSSMPSVHIPVTQEDPENMATPNYNSDNTSAITGEIATAEPETNEEMGEADDTMEGPWNARRAGSEASKDVKFFTSNDIMQAVLAMGTQMRSLT